MDIDFSQFSREDFKINGFRRAIVEDNDDPTNSGRVRVRIIGIHSLDGDETKISHLPWAEPCLSLYTSGGFNVKNNNTTTPVTRYESGADGGKVLQDRPSKQETKLRLISEWQDQTTQNNGTGAHFVVPAKGTMVWIFFDDGNHLKPQYFGASPRKLDWDTQFEKLSADLKDKEQTLLNLFDEMEALESNNQQFNGVRQITQNIQIKTPILRPNFNFDADNFNTTAKNKDLSSWTSPGGVTFLAINDNNNGSNEKVFIMHKGYLEHVDQSGQRTVLIGKTNETSTDPLSPQHAEGKGNDIRNIVSNNSELYVLGDHKIFVKGNSFIQCEKSVEINAKEEVGIFSREGNVNILAESADINIESKSANFNVSSTNSQFLVDSQFLVKSKGPIKFESDESIDFVAPLVQIGAENQFTVDAGGVVMSVEDSKFEITPAEFLVDVSGEISQKCSQHITDSKESIQQKTTSYNIAVNNEYVLDVTTNLNIKSQKIAIEGSSFSAKANGVMKLKGAVASYGADGQCFVGGGVTQVGGTVSLGQGEATETDPVTNAVVSPPTPPKQPAEIQALEFQPSSEAKVIKAKETNFPNEEA